MLDLFNTRIIDNFPTFLKGYLKKEKHQKILFSNCKPVPNQAEGIF